MTARPWGTTGWVTLEGDVSDPRSLPNVYVDGEWVGWLYTPDDGHPKWGARSHDPEAQRDDLPSLDAAVMWVLRRADADVWRQERGSVPTVWRSRFYDPGKWRTEWRGGRVLVSDTHAEALAAALGPTP